MKDRSRNNPGPCSVYDIATQTVVTSIELSGRETNQARDNPELVKDETDLLPASERQQRRQATTRGLTRQLDSPSLTDEMDVFYA
jgi:hypothetical protein